MRKVWVSFIAAAALLAAMAVPSLAATTVYCRTTRTVCSTGTGYRVIRIFYTGKAYTPAPTPTPAPAPKPTPTPTPTPTPVPPAQGLTADESYIFQQVNAERAKAGLGSLQLNSSLVQTARAKSRDMIQNRYFGHQSPTLGSPFDQMKAAGITYRTAGENIAGNPSAAGAMQSWMNSPGHRANILSPSFTQIGIGVADGGPYGKMLTQQFIGIW